MTGALIHTSQAAPGDLLWSDNFNLGSESTKFDESSLAGRLGGPLGSGPDCVARASGIQQWITADQLNLRGGRIRFQRAAAGPNYDWSGTAPGSTAASIAAAANILATGGMKIAFDHVPTNNTSDNWVNVSVGISSTFDGGAVGNPQTDYTVLLRNNGGTERFDNGVNKGPGRSFPATTTSRHAEYLYAFSSFADGTTVLSKVIVDGITVAEETFVLDNNAGQFYFVVEVGEVGNLVDNLTVTADPNTTTGQYTVTAVGDEFISAIAPGDPVATLSGSIFPTGPVASTFAFVSGLGDTDNGKFVIDGSTIKVKTGAEAFDFTQDTDGTQYFIRVEGTNTTATGGTQEYEHVFTLIKDDDADGLRDPWELDFAGNLTDLDGLKNGPGPGADTGDFDGDGLTDLAEYILSLEAFPTISPMLADTDGDTLNDKEEQNPVVPRQVTNPVVADTDKDGLSDSIESNSGTFVGPLDSGSKAADPDTDDDGVRDGFEVANASNPVIFASRPPLPPAFAIAPLTDDASTGISASTTYTHKISGGGEATINGVLLEQLNPNSSPTDFTWTVSANTRAEVDPINLSTWVPADGGVTGAGVLEMLGGFTYNTNNGPEGFQTYTLSGLEIGNSYKLKIFVRPRAKTDPSFRLIDLSVTNGATVEAPFGALATDRHGSVLNNANNDSAYYVSYDYVAEATDLVIEARVHESALQDSGSFHLYGLTNEVVSASAFTNWIATFNPPLTNPADRGDNADPDKDSIANLLEFVLNGNPSSSDLAILPVLSASGANFVFNFTRRADSASEVSQVFEYSTDLVDWTTNTPVTIPSTPGTSGIVTVGASTGTAPNEVQAVSITIPKGANTRMFGRLKAVK